MSTAVAKKDGEPPPSPGSPSPSPSAAVRPKTSAHLYAGFVSGLTSAVLLQPLDLLKTRVQQSNGISLASSIKEIKHLPSLWRGTIPSALRTSIGSALYFTSLNHTRTLLANVLEPQRARNSQRSSTILPSLSMYANLASGSFVRGAVGFATMPITVIKVRYESSFYNYNSIMGACKDIFKQHGIRGFFYGYGVTFARDAPYAGIYVLFYEKSKDLLNKFVNGSSASPSTVTTSQGALINSSSAVFSATMATTITGPFDTIKTRVQLDPAKYRNVIYCSKVILQQSGVRGLFDGLSLRLARKAMSAGIAWCIYEELVKKL